jgi:hypothetical protein
MSNSIVVTDLTISTADQLNLGIGQSQNLTRHVFPEVQSPASNIVQYSGYLAIPSTTVLLGIVPVVNLAQIFFAYLRNPGPNDVIVTWNTNQSAVGNMAFLLRAGGQWLYDNPSLDVPAKAAIILLSVTPTNNQNAVVEYLVAG